MQEVRNPLSAIAVLPARTHNRICLDGKRMVLKYALGCAVAALSSISTMAQAQTGDSRTMGWTVYRESDLSVDFPSALFPREAGKSDVGEGRRYRTPNGLATLMIYQLRNDRSWTPQSYLGKHLAIPRGRLQYKRVTTRFFAISGIKDETTFYSRCNFSNRYLGCIYLKYPAQDTRLWDSVVTRISLSLRVGSS